MDTYAIWRVAAYRSFIGARALFGLSMQMQSTAVAWQVYESFGTTIALAYVGLIQVLPVLILALPAGHLADNFDRRRIIVGAQAVFLLSSIGLFFLTRWDGPPHWLYLLVVAPGIVRALIAPALSSLLPNLVAKEHWGAAAKWNSSVMELSTVIGPTVAGTIIGLTGSALWVYAVAAGCAVACMFLVASLPSTPRAGQRYPLKWVELLGGLRFLWNTRLMLAAASLDLFSVFFGGATALLPAVAKDILQVGPHGYGWLRAAPSIGALTMAIATAHVRPWKRSGRVLFGAFVGFGLATMVFGWSRNFWLSMAMLFVTGACDNLNVVIRQTLFQFLTPDHLKGRVSAINFIFIGCSNELGAFESGFTAQLFGMVPAIVGGGAATLLIATLVMRLAPQLRRLGPLQDVQPAST